MISNIVYKDFIDLGRIYRLDSDISQDGLTIGGTSQLIQKILSEEYLRLHRSPPGVMKKSSDQKSNSSTNDQQKQQHPALGALLMTNFSPDSAYSSSSSTAAAYSPAEQPQLQPVNSTPSSSNI